MNGPLANQFSDFDFDVFCKDFKSHIYKAYLQVCTYYLVLGTKSLDSMLTSVDFFGASQHPRLHKCKILSNILGRFGYFVIKRYCQVGTT